MRKSPLSEVIAYRLTCVSLVDHNDLRATDGGFALLDHDAGESAVELSSCRTRKKTEVSDYRNQEDC